jgi:hypothetical protein
MLLILNAYNPCFMKAWTTQFSVQPHVESVLEWGRIHEASCQTDD